MFKQLEEAVIAIQIIAVSIVFIACLIASAGTALLCILITQRTSHGPVRQNGYSTSRLGCRPVYGCPCSGTRCRVESLDARDVEEDGCAPENTIL